MLPDATVLWFLIILNRGTVYQQLGPFETKAACVATGKALQNNESGLEYLCARNR